MNATIHDTVSLTRCVDASAAEAWAAYADPGKRAKWSVSAGEAMVYDESDFREGGRDRYRCGPPETLEFHAEAEYTRIVPEELIVCTETVRTEGRSLATSIVAWEFTPHGGKTLVEVTAQVVSFVGQGMIDGTRDGHAKALEQLEEFLVG